MNKEKIVEQGLAKNALSYPRQDYTRQLINAIPHFDPEQM